MANRVHCSSKGARHAVHRCEKLAAAHRAGDLQFFGEPQALEKAEAFAAFLKPLRQIDWVVYAKRPFAGSQAVLAYLSRYTHRVAIANSRLIALDEHGGTSASAVSAAGKGRRLNSPVPRIPSTGKGSRVVNASRVEWT